jgi:hypothetical protein
MANMKLIPLIAAGDEAAVKDAATMIELMRDDVGHEIDQIARVLDDDIERLTERIRTTEIAYLDQQAVIDALRLDLGALEYRIARLEQTLPASSYEAKKGVP